MSQGKISIIELNNTLNDFLSRTDDTQASGTETTQNPSDSEPPIAQYKPIELTNYLKEYILGQDEAIDIIATKICTHFNRMAYERKHSTLEPLLNRIKSNMLLIGPTGVGKTYILKLIAHKLGVPFIKADATKFTETGYVGGDVEDLVRGLVNEANGNIHLAEYGIVYLDEIDKIASTKNSYGPDVSKKGVQHNLLKIMEESEIDLKNPLDISSQMRAVMQAHQTGKSETKKINTRNILFVMSGAFQDLSDIIKKRLKHNTLGFLQSQDARSTHNEPAEYLKYVQSEDLIEYGFESEFVGRLPVVAVLNPLDQEHLYQILKAPKNTLINSKKRDFKAYDIDIEFDDEALYEVSKYACTEKTGARSLMSILEKRLIYFEKHLPSTSMKHLQVTKDLIHQPQRHLKYLLTKDATQQIREIFEKQHAITLDFSDDAVEYIMHYADSHSVSPYEALTKHLENYGYGLKLVNQSSLTVTQELLQNKEQYLDSLVKSSYKVSKKL